MRSILPVATAIAAIVATGVYASRPEVAFAEPPAHPPGEHGEAPPEPAPRAEEAPAEKAPRGEEPPPPVASEVAITEVSGCASFDAVITTPFPEGTTIKVNQIVKLAPTSPHDVTSGRPGAADKKFGAQSGEVRCYRFTEAGTFPYHCSAHPSMQGSIVVQ